MVNLGPCSHPLNWQLIFLCEENQQKMAKLHLRLNKDMAAKSGHGCGVSIFKGNLHKGGSCFFFPTCAVSGFRSGGLILFESAK